MYTNKDSISTQHFFQCSFSLRNIQISNYFNVVVLLFSICRILFIFDDRVPSRHERSVNHSVLLCWKAEIYSHIASSTFQWQWFTESCPVHRMSFLFSKYISSCLQIGLRSWLLFNLKSQIIARFCISSVYWAVH